MKDPVTFSAAGDDYVEPIFSTIHDAAIKLGVTQTWLKREIESFKLPSIMAGQQRLVHVPTIVIHLIRRAELDCKQGDQ